MVTATTRTLYPRKTEPVPTEQKAVWAPRPVWTGVVKVALTGIRSPDRPANSKSLYGLRYPGPSDMTGRQRNPFGMKRYVNKHVLPDVSNDRAPFILWHYDTSKRREPPTRL